MSMIEARDVSGIPPDLLGASLALNREQRAALAGRLLLSLEPELEDQGSDGWDDELERRYQRFASGASVGIPAEDSIARIREGLRRRRAL